MLNIFWLCIFLSCCFSLEEENGPSNVTDGLKPNDSAISVDISGAEEEDNCGNCREQDKEDEQLPPEFMWVKTSINKKMCYKKLGKQTVEFSKVAVFYA